MSCKNQTTYCVWVAYDGSNFSGWAKQKALRTVEGQINKILSAIFKVDVVISGASRTDTGVHAYDQIFTFSLPVSLDAIKMTAILQQHFIYDIKIKKVQIVEENYQVRNYVVMKQYRYYINIGTHNPFKINYQYQFNKKLPIRKLKAALKLFLGRNYFYSFSGLSQDDKKSPYRTIDRIKVYQWRKQLVIIIQGKGFLRYQIRYIIAAAIDYCQDKVTLDEIKKYLASDSKEKYPFPKAPAQGLYLYQIKLRNKI